MNNYLIHWGTEKGSQRKDHKYVYRTIGPNGKYKYFYTRNEYEAWKNRGKSPTQTKKEYGPENGVYNANDKRQRELAALAGKETDEKLRQQYIDEGKKQYTKLERFLRTLLVSDVDSYYEYAGRYGREEASLENARRGYVWANEPRDNRKRR